jgi:hypothetical protein
MRNRSHHAVPLCLCACRENNRETCEDHLANHGSHLKARPAESFTNNLFPNTTSKDALSVA